MIRLLLERIGLRLHDPGPGCVYPYGSVGWDNDDDDPIKRRERWACSSVNHYPRKRFDGWCMGFGYGCVRCGMWADPWPRARLEAVCKEANRRESRGEVLNLGDMCK